MSVIKIWSVLAYLFGKPGESGSLDPKTQGVTHARGA